MQTSAQTTTPSTSKTNAVYGPWQAVIMMSREDIKRLSDALDAASHALAAAAVARQRAGAARLSADTLKALRIAEAQALDIYNRAYDAYDAAIEAYENTRRAARH